MPFSSIVNDYTISISFGIQKSIEVVPKEFKTAKAILFFFQAKTNLATQKCLVRRLM